MRRFVCLRCANVNERWYAAVLPQAKAGTVKSMPEAGSTAAIAMEQRQQLLAQVR